MPKADIDKSKQELIDELADLRGRLARTPSSGRGRREDRSSRTPLIAEIELIADFDILQASGINLSDTGIAFETSGPLFFEMRFKHEGRVYHNRARLVWLQSSGQGQSRLGLEFSLLQRGAEL